MARRIEVDVISLGNGSRAERPNGLVGDLEVVDHHVDVELLRRRRIRPMRRYVVGRQLERET